MQHQFLTVTDLLKDESFINFCRRQNEPDISRWKSYISEHPDQKPLIDEAMHEYSLLFTAMANADLEEQMQKLRMKLEAADNAPVVSLPSTEQSFLRRYRFVIGIAAIFLMTAGFFLYYQPDQTTVAAAALEYASLPGERKSFQLPDGTQVSLNAGSSIRVSNTFGQITREIFLKGEAFFEVQHNKQLPFIVHTNDMDVKALGTAFNVRSYTGENTETSLLRGLVEVTLKKDNNRKVLLRPEEKILWKGVTGAGKPAPKLAPATKTDNIDQPAIRPVRKLDDGSVKEVAWLENKLVFDDEPFEAIVPQLARWYDVDISFDAEEVKHYHFTATFTKENLGQVLDILKISKTFKYRINGKTIIITK